MEQVAFELGIVGIEWSELEGKDAPSGRNSDSKGLAARNLKDMLGNVRRQVWCEPKL